MAISKFNYNSFNVTPVASAALTFDADADGFSTGTSTSLTLIKTLTASSSASISFVHGSSDVVFDNTYPVYIFKFINEHPGTADRELVFQGTTDGSNYNTTMTATYFYSYNNEAGTTQNLGADTARDQSSGTDFQRISLPTKPDNDSSGSGELMIFNPSSTTFTKHFVARTSSYSQDSMAQDVYTAGYFNTTSAITGIQFKQRTGNIDSGSFKLYGIKDS